MALKSTWRRVDELEADKQDALISGVNIKTINSTSLLGSGDISISGGGVSDGDKGDISVSGSGSVWTIDNLAVTNAKINDIAATKVTEDSTHRFVTDSEKSTWNGKQDALISGTNIKTIGGSSILGAGNLPIPDPEGWTTIVKSANQDVTNNATFQDDTELQFSVVAGGHYMVEMNICWSGNNATSDYDPRFLITAGVLNGGGIALVSDQPTPRQIVSASASVGFGSWNLSSTSIDFLNTAVIQFNFNPSANSTFKFQFRNASAGAGRISRTWKGSILKYKRID